MYKLIIQDDEGKTTVVPLIRDEITIGRREGNSIRLTERNVSRRHARIVKANGSIVVEDLDSYNGVKVNGTRIAGRVSVNESDRIQIGDYVLELKVERAAGDAYPTGPTSGQYAPGGSPGMATAPNPAVPMSMQPTPAMGQMGALAPQNGGMARSVQTKATAPMPAFQGDGAAAAPMAMGTPAPEVVPGSEGPGRLVIVSSNFGGREFVLDKPSMVIGRTDDNDIVVNHRSISRHHAKVVLEQGRYCIVDMQSSNGVRVNGEDYGKVELRRGDMIDLGHVRMRYVDPGEDFVFDRDAQLVDVAVRSGKGKGAIIAAMSLVAVGAVVAVVIVTQRGGTTVASAPTATAPIAAAPAPAPAAAAAPATRPTAEPPAPPAMAVVAPAASADAGAAAAAATPAPKPHEKPAEEPAPPAEPAKDTAKLIAEARDAVAAEKWVPALSAAEQVLRIDPSNADAKKIQEQANAEFRNQTTYEKLAQARDSGKVDEVARLAREIPDGSVYKTKASADLVKLHDQYIHEREADAKSFAARGQCDKIKNLAYRAAQVFPDARAAVEKAGAGCTPIAVKPVEPAERPTAAASPSQPSEAELSALVTDAKEAARNGNWAEARKKADDVLRFRPGDQDALSVGGIAACNLLDRERALKYIDRLKGQRQTMMKQICATKGLTIE